MGKHVIHAQPTSTRSVRAPAVGLRVQAWRAACWMLALLLLASLLPAAAHAASALDARAPDTALELRASTPDAHDEAPHEPEQHRELPAKKSRLTSLQVQDAPTLRMRHRAGIAAPRAHRLNVHAGSPPAAENPLRLRPDPSLRLHPGQAPPRAA